MIRAPPLATGEPIIAQGRSYGIQGRYAHAGRPVDQNRTRRAGGSSYTIEHERIAEHRSAGLRHGRRRGGQTLARTTRTTDRQGWPAREPEASRGPRPEQVAGGPVASRTGFDR